MVRCRQGIEGCPWGLIRGGAGPREGPDLQRDKFSRIGTSAFLYLRADLTYEWPHETASRSGSLTVKGVRVLRRFRLERAIDVTGISGTGVVAEGVEFSDGVVAMRWCSRWPTSVVFHDMGIRAVEAVHGHGGATKVVWLDERSAE